MSEKQKYTAEDIRLYLEGKLTPSQMHALEKEALNDPFLADALEGMDLFKNKDQFVTDTGELRARLYERVKSRKAVVAPVGRMWWKIAAVLVIVVTGVAVIIFTGQKNNSADSTLAKTEEIHDTVVQQKAETAAAAPAAPLLLRDSNEKNIVTKKTPQKTLPAQSESKQDVPVKKYSAIPGKQDNELNETVVSAPSVKNADTTQQVSDQLQGRAAGIEVVSANRKRKISESPTFIDESGRAVEVVVVKLRKSNKALSSRESSIPEESEKRRVSPEKGWDHFEQYLEDSTQLAKMDSTVTGEETISFSIDDEGLPKEIRILRSISEEHDKEAIRLLQEGPAWKVLKGKKRHITLRIIF